MHRNEKFRKIARLFIVAFLCSEMQSSFTQQDTTENMAKSFLSLNGTEVATLESSKHQASIRLTARDSVFGEGHVCSGALIAPAVVLTAASCIYNYRSESRRHPSEFRVVLGSVDRYRRTAHTLVYGVTHASHPATFDPRTRRDDIALLWLERDIPERHPAVQPIALATLARRHHQQQEDPQNPATTLLDSFTQTSWDRSDKGPRSSALLRSNITRLPLERCSRALASHWAPGLLCADLTLPSEDEVCLRGEVGAPLVQDNQLAGIASGTRRCAASQRQPALYTDVAHHAKWIRDNVGAGTNQNSSVWGSLGFLVFTVVTLKTALAGKC